MKVRYVIIIVAVMLLVGSAAAWQFDGWQYEKTLTITGSSAGEQTDYQMKIIVHRTTGTDSGADVYVGDHCEEDYRDIRFSQGLLCPFGSGLDYWIESADSSSATIWVEVPTIPADGTTIEMYYGNPSATEVSNGDDTFLFFDHFDGTTLDTGKWTKYYGDSPIISNSIANLSNNNVDSSLISKNRVTDDQTSVILRLKSAHFQNVADYREIVYPKYIDGSHDVVAFLSYGSTTVGKKYRNNNGGTATYNNIVGWSGNEYHILECKLSDKSIWEIDGINNVALSSNYPTGPAYLRFTVSTVKGSEIDVDYILVRNYISPEPTSSSWGSEQVYDPNLDNIIMPDEMPFEINDTVVAQCGLNYYIGGDWTGSDTDLYAVHIVSPNIVLGGQNYLLTGTLDSDEETQQNAIEVNAPNTTVHHVEATGWDHGIGYNAVNYGWIDQNHLYGNAESGIGAISCSDLFIAGNILEDNAHNGMWIGDSTGITVMNEISQATQITGSGAGIAFSNVTGGTISDGIATGNSIGIVIRQSSDIEVRNFTASANIDLGILGEQASDSITIRDSMLNDNAGGEFSSGIGMFEVSNVILENNTITGNQDRGIDFGTVEGGSITGNTITNNGGGMWLFYCSDLVVDNNEINDQTSDNGIMVGESGNITVLGNALDNNKFGIWNQHVSSGSIIGNTVTNTGSNGISVVGGSSSVSIVGNTVTTSIGVGGDYAPGILIDDGSSMAVLFNTVSDCNNSGIQLTTVTDGVVSWNTVNSNRENGIATHNVENVTAQSNTATSNSNAGLMFANSRLITALDNTASENNNFGIWCHNVTGASNLISGNIAEGNIQTGIGVVFSDSVLVMDNQAFQNSGAEYSQGIQVGDSTNVIVRNNSAYENQNVGISYNQAQFGSILNNTASRNGQTGISVQGSDILIEDNTAEYNTGDGGIVVVNSYNVSSRRNSVLYSRLGLWYHNTTDSEIVSNIAAFNSETGMGAVAESARIFIFGNAIEANPTGLALENGVSSILVANNYFNNTDYNLGVPFEISGITWNRTSTPGLNIVKGPNFGGNYWAQPDGLGWSETQPDSNGDGFTDAAYDLLGDGINIDYLPLGGIPPEPVHAQFSADPGEGNASDTQPLIVQFTDQSTGPVTQWFWDFDDGTTSTEQNPSHEFSWCGLFGVTLTATNSETGQSSTCWAPIYVRPFVPAGVPIWQGWNFISIPKTLQAGYNTPGVVFADIYDQMDGKPILKYNADVNGWHQVLEDEPLQTLEGYWVYSTQVGPFVPYQYSTDNTPVAPRIKHLEQGWNAIGMGCLYSLQTVEYLGTSLDWSTLLEFDSGTQVYYPPQVAWVNTWDMQPTRGYWIYMNEPGDLLAVTG